jgi:hypothetical protein
MKDIQKAVVVFLLPDMASKYSTTKYNSECVLCFYTTFFHIVSLLLDTTLPVVSKIQAVLQSISYNSLKFVITYEINFFEICK